MSTNWIRYLSITAQGANGSVDLANLRCRFDIQQFTTETPNIAEIIITNPAPATVQAFINQEYKTITVDAGYLDNHGIVFTGDISQARYGRENPTDTWLLITSRDMDRAYNFATVSKTFAAGSTPQDHYNEALKALIGLGATKGYQGVDLSKPVYPRAVTLYGMARNVMRNIAVSHSATWSGQNGAVQMLGLHQTLPGGPIIVNSQTGLIGMPEQRITGIAARVLINPTIKVHTIIQIDQGLIQRSKYFLNAAGTTADPRNYALPSVAADGLYKVLQITVDGDSRSDPWYMDLLCIAASGNTYIPPNLALYQGTE